MGPETRPMTQPSGRGVGRKGANLPKSTKKPLHKGLGANGYRRILWVGERFLLQLLAPCGVVSLFRAGVVPDRENPAFTEREPARCLTKGYDHRAGFLLPESLDGPAEGATDKEPARGGVDASSKVSKQAGNGCTVPTRKGWRASVHSTVVGQRWLGAWRKYRETTHGTRYRQAARGTSELTGAEETALKQLSLARWAKGKLCIALNLQGRVALCYCLRHSEVWCKKHTETTRCEFESRRPSGRGVMVACVVSLPRGVTVAHPALTRKELVQFQSGQFHNPQAAIPAPMESEGA